MARLSYYTLVLFLSTALLTFISCTQQAIPTIPSGLSPEFYEPIRPLPLDPQESVYSAVSSNELTFFVLVHPPRIAYGTVRSGAIIDSHTIVPASRARVFLLEHTELDEATLLFAYGRLRSSPWTPGTWVETLQFVRWNTTSGERVLDTNITLSNHSLSYASDYELYNNRSILHGNGTILWWSEIWRRTSNGGLIGFGALTYDDTFQTDLATLERVAPSTFAKHCQRQRGKDARIHCEDALGLRYAVAVINRTGHLVTLTRVIDDRSSLMQIPPLDQPNATLAAIIDGQAKQAENWFILD